MNPLLQKKKKQIGVLSYTDIDNNRDIWKKEILIPC